MRVVIILILLLSGLGSKAQNSNQFEVKPLTLAENFPKKGTYQIVLKPSTDKIEIPNEILIEAERKRDQNLITYIQFNENVRIRIYPFVTINAPGFEPYEEYVYE